MAHTLIVYSGNDPHYLSLVSHLVDRAENDGLIPRLLDLTSIVDGTGDAYNRSVLRSFRIMSPDSRFASLMVARGIVPLSAETLLVGVTPTIPDAAAAGITESTRSALISYARDPEPSHHRVWNRLENSLHKSGVDSFRAVAELLRREPHIETVHIANGRFPHQRGAIEATHAAGKTVRYYEKGERADSYWLQDHSTLDRVTTQSRVDATLAHLTPAEALEVGRQWMNNRAASGSALNIYSRFFSDDGDANSNSDSGQHDSHSSKRMIGMFTSSQDEFASLGPEWHLDSWADQWDGFDHVMTRLGHADFEYYLRIHPNFATKSHASFLRERAKIVEISERHPQLRIIWHDEKVSSYSLLAQSDAAVVWDSTVGLEASGRAIPVWELAASYYDLYADVKQWFDPASGPASAKLFADVDTDRTHRFMAYLALRDDALPPETALFRDGLVPPPSLGSSLAALANTGGAPTIAVALRSILDSFRHRSASVNRVAFAKFAGRSR